MFCEQPLFIVNKSVTKIRILGINPILYVLKQLFGQTNISLFLLYFFTILDLLTWSSTNTSCYYFFGLLFTKCCSLDFSYHILVVCCWPVYSHWSYQYSLIRHLYSGVLETFLWAVYKLYIRTCFPLKFVEGHGESAGWMFRLVDFNWFICLI